MVSNAAEGWALQDPNIISYGEYKLYDDESIYLGQPLAIDTAHGTSGVDTGDYNKVWLKAYDDTTFVEGCPGVSITNRLAKGHTDADRLGLGGYRRDLRLIQWGIIPMLHMGTSETVYFKEKVSPAPGGFVKWLPAIVETFGLLAREAVNVGAGDPTEYFAVAGITPIAAGSARTEYTGLGYLWQYKSVTGNMSLVFVMPC